MLTRAEASGWQETSRHADVVAFCHELGKQGARVESFGASPEGRDLPLVVLGDGRRPVVLVQCGIHAGEVEGKEAALMLLRDLLAGKHPGLIDGMTLVVVPLYNADGNDRIDPRNRALDLAKLEGQIGPEGGVGTRVNASGVNLNRDYLRQDAPETRLLHHEVWLRWKPDLTIDCHSTNGSVHRFQLTYDTPHTIDSGAAAPIRFMRDVFLPEVTRRVRAASGRETFFYGNFVADEGGAGEGWVTYPHHPRFGSNYRGLTGRMDLLLETYSYQPFAERVATTYEFLVESLRFAGEHGAEMCRIVDEAQRPPARVAIRYRLEAEAEPARILTRAPRVLDGAEIEVTIPHLARFVGDRFVERPYGYAVPPELGRRLAGHGLASTVLAEGGQARVAVARLRGASGEGARKILEASGERLFEVTWTEETRQLPAGTWVIETEQPLGAIAVYLCEPESDDNLVTCGWAPEPTEGEEWPVLRVLALIP